MRERGGEPHQMEKKQMRKTTTIALAFALALGAGTADAQGQQGEQGKAKAGEQRGARGEGRGFGRRGGGDGLLLKDITLTDAQKTQLQALRKSEKDRMQASRDQFSDVTKEAREARQRGDTAAFRAKMEQVRSQRMQYRQAHLSAVRNILTAEQRTQFDKNVVELEQRQKERAARGGHGEGKGERGKGRGGRPAGARGQQG
jgi:Spy/CpxP family protein refolding chaperone